MPKQLNEFAQEPEMGAETGHNLPSTEADHEGAMAKADLFKLAKYSLKLFKQMGDDDQLEAWVQAKITKAADYIASVYHYLEYEMKFSEYGAKLENSGMYNESEKLELRNKLNEARAAMAEWKIAQADRLDEGKKAKKDYDGDGKVESGKDEYLGSKIRAAKKAGKMDESMGGDLQPCETCGGTGHVQTPAKSWSPEAKAKAAAYNRKVKAYAAGAKRIDANKNGIPDDEEGAEAPAAKKPAAKKPAAKKEPAEKKNNIDPNNTTSKSSSGVGTGIYEGEEESSTGGKTTREGDKITHRREYKGAGKEDKINTRHGDNRDERHVGQGGNMNVHNVSGGKKGPLSSDDLEEGKDEGKPGKNFAKIAKKAGKEYGSKEAGERVAGAVRAKLKKAGKLEEGAFDAISNAASKVGTALGFDTEENLAKKSPQLQQLLAMRKKYPDGSPEAKQLDARIQAQKDRVSMDQGEVGGQGGNPKSVVDPTTFKQQNPNFKYENSMNESAELTRMKEFLTRLNG